METAQPERVCGNNGNEYFRPCHKYSLLTFKVTLGKNALTVYIKNMVSVIANANNEPNAPNLNPTINIKFSAKLTMKYNKLLLAYFLLSSFACNVLWKIV